MHEEQAGPISPATLAILLSLVEGAQHGYGILKAVERQPGAPRLGAGTLYAALQRLVQDGWIRESAERPGPEEDQRRRYYQLTEAGGEAARRELTRLAGVVAMAQSRSLLGGARLPRLAEEAG
jgi:DNA-binding PadR family transcriptional regulator